VTDSLSLILGGRLSSYKYATSRDPEGFKLNENFTPYAGLSWSFDDNHNLYASYTQVFEPQGAINKNGNLLSPITGTNYETGIKGEYFDGKLNLSVAVFLIRQRNRPVDDLTSMNPCPGTTWGYCQRASGEIESKGGELELSGKLTENWNLTAGYSYASAKYYKDIDTSLIGKRFDPSTPEHQFKLLSNYEFSGALDGWNLGGSLRYQSQMERGGWGGYYEYIEPQAGYTLVGLYTGYRINKTWRVTMNVNNLFDKTYYTGLGWGESSRTYGTPRNVMVKLLAKF
jgi:outer-membrane receptor for ferric coprogen and ferric-rhodotorulic acid